MSRFLTPRQPAVASQRVLSGDKPCFPTLDPVADLPLAEPVGPAPIRTPSL